MRGLWLVCACIGRAAGLAAPAPPLAWVVVGGGPHGVHIAARLLGEVDGVTPATLRIVDDDATLLRKWKRRAAATGMRYLRSPASSNLGVRDDSLWRHAGGSKGGAFASDYSRPRLDVFDAHCDHVVATSGLADAHVRGTATEIAPSDDGVRVTVATSNGAVALDAARVVLALGNAAPAYPAWVDRGSDRVTHVLDVDAAVSGDGAVAIVGGGLSAVALALALAEDRVDVHVICRHAVRERQFDVHQDWMMTAAGARRSRQHNAFTPKQRAFARSEIDERRRAIDRERRAGTVPASVSRGRGGLKYAIAEGRVAWHAADVEAMSDDGGRVRLALSTGDAVVVDRVVLATGFGAEMPGAALVDDLAASADLARGPCGYPAPDDRLRWHPRVSVAGALAELELGPSARNIAGARLAAERIIADARGETPPLPGDAQGG